MIYNHIPRRLELGGDRNYDSNRGPYTLVANFQDFIFDIEFLDLEFQRWNNCEKFFKLVEDEMDLYYRNDIEGLRNHPFWKGDEEYLLDGYVKLHSDFIKKIESETYLTSRNIVAANADTCLTLLQRHNNNLYATSRSCDISLGFLADLYTLYLYAKKYKLAHIRWTINTPHIYLNNLNGTIEQFGTKTKNRTLLFNKRTKL